MSTENEKVVVTMESKVWEVVKELKLVDVDSEEFAVKKILALIHRIQFPDNYCEKCGERMFFSEGNFVCDVHGKVVADISYPHLKPAVPSSEAVPTLRKKSNVSELARKLNGGSVNTNIPGMSGEVPAGAASKDITWV